MSMSVPVAQMRIAREEIFGPVLVMIPYQTEEEAVRIANDTVYGLSGYVYSGNIDHARAANVATVKARVKVEAFVGAAVYLDLWVKVLPNWRKSDSAVRRMLPPWPGPRGRCPGCAARCDR